MAILTGLFGVLGRFAGRLLNSTLGWATILLFGKVSGRKQIVLLIVALAALLEVVLIVGIAFPDVGTFLIAFVPLSAFVSKDVVRILMIVLAVIVPLAVGGAGIFMTEAGRRPKGVSLVTALLRGFPFTILLAVTIAVLGVVALVRKIRALANRWEDAHVAVIVQPGRYDEVLAGLEQVLRDGGLDVRQRTAPAVISIPPRLLSKAAGSGVGGLVPDRLVMLKAAAFEALIYPSDIALTGPKEQVGLARALIATKLTDVPAYMTTSAQSERIEDDLKAIRRASRAAALEQLEVVDAKLLRLAVPYEEWETTYRERLQVERDILVETETAPERDAARRLTARDGPNKLERTLAIGAVAVVVVDAILLAADRLTGRGRV